MRGEVRCRCVRPLPLLRNRRREDEKGGDEPEEADGDEPEADAPEEADNEQEEAPEPEPDPKPKATKGKATKGAATKGKATKGAATKGKATKGKGKAKKAELVTVDVDPRFSVNDLDNAVKRANDLTRAGAVVAYELGVQLRQIHEDQLWKLRKGEDGAPVYKSFEAFVMSELEISRQTAYEQIDVSANYEKGDVEKLGYKKLALLLKAPETKRPELKEKAEKGASFRELQADVKTARAEAGVTKRETGRKATPQGKARDSKSGKGDSITIAALLGKQSVKLFKDIKKSGSEELVPAESLDDKPWGMLELRNGVVEVFYLTKTAKGARAPGQD